MISANVFIFFHHLNSIEPSIQFTVERESEGRISFLDANMIWKENSQLSSVEYRNPAHTDRYLAYETRHPIALKKYVVRALVDRARNIPSCSFEKNKEKQLVIHALTANGYPRWFILEASKPRRPVTPLVPDKTES